MASFTWKSGVSGAWANDALWAGNVAPNDALAAVTINQPGAYTVSIFAGEAFGVRTLNVAPSVDLSIAGSLSLGANSSLGDTSIASTGRLAGQGLVTMSGTLVNQGVLSADVAGGFLHPFLGTITNLGTFEAPVSGSFLFLDQVNFTNLSGGILAGGTYTATGNFGGGPVATILFAAPSGSSTITTLDARVTLRYVNSRIIGRTTPSGADVMLESSLTSIAPNGVLEILDARNYATANALAVNGTFRLGGGTLSAAGGLAVGTTGTVQGYGTITTPTSVDGILRSSGGTLALNSALAGNGTLSIDAGATLQVQGGVYNHTITGAGVLRAQAGSVKLTGSITGAPTFQVQAGSSIDLSAGGSSTLAFLGTNATVKLGNAASFNGTLVGFQSSNTLDLVGVAATSASVAGDRLSLATANGNVTFKLDGDYTGKTFNLAADGAGGTNVTVSNVSFALSGQAWGDRDVTWSFAQANYAMPFAIFSGFVNAASQPALAQLWRDAFSRWSAVSGISFTEVADTPTASGQADIRVGWGNFGNPPLGEIGQANYSYTTATNVLNPGVLVRVQDPSITPLMNSNGALVFQGTQSSVYQIMLHEIGHALGLSHASAVIDPNSVMQPTSSSTNRDLDISDIAGIRAAYSGIAIDNIARFAITGAAGLDEGNGTATPFTFTVTRTGNLLATHSVAYTVDTSGAAPVQANDFVGGVLPSGILTFASGETSKTITLSIAGDADVEANENLVVVLSGASVGATISTTSAARSVVNDDARLDVVIGISPPAEGTASTNSAAFMVSRTGDTTRAHSATWSVTGVGANAATASDFLGGVLPSGIVSFAAGETTRLVSIAIANDAAIEADETFVVTLSNASPGASIGTAATLPLPITIVNDDAQISIAATSASKPEGTGAALPTAFTFTATRTGDLSRVHTAAWSVTGVAGSGTLPADAADFGGTMPSGMISFAVGEAARIITVSIAADAIAEFNERFAVTLSAPSAGAVLGTASAQGVIFNDDTSFSVAALSANLTEGDTGSVATVFSISRSGITSGNQAVSWSVTGTGPTPANAADFLGGILPGGTLNFAAGETSKLVTINVAGDTLVEANETFQLMLSAPTNGASIATAVASRTILSDDAQISIAATSASKPEGTGAATAFTFAATRTGDLSRVHTASWSAVGIAGSGTLPADAVDFGGTLPSGVISFAVGEVSKIITVTVAGDSGSELNERFAVTLAAPSAGAVLGTASAQGVIFNDDTSFSIVALSANPTEGDTGSVATVFTISRSGITTGNQAVSWSVIGSGAIPANAADFLGGILPGGTLSFAAGETSKLVTVSVAGDTLVEGNETFQLVLSAPTNGASIATAAATRTILSDDAQISIAATSASKPEGTGAATAFTFTATRTGDVSRVHTASWSVAGATGSGTLPADAADFGGTLPSGTISFAVGEVSKIITVTVAGDSGYELNERFAVTLSAPAAGAVLGIASAQGVIYDDDAITGTAGDDVLTGSDGADVFLIGTGVDFITGGLGTDRFIYLPNALTGTFSGIVITDFDPANLEKVDLSRLDAIAGTLANDAFSFIGTNAFGFVSGQLRWQDDMGQAYVQGDTNGDGIADLNLILSTPIPATASWFIL